MTVRVFIRGREGLHPEEDRTEVASCSQSLGQHAGYRNRHTVSPRTSSTVLSCLQMEDVRIERTNIFSFYDYLSQEIKKIFISCECF